MRFFMTLFVLSIGCGRAATPPPGNVEGSAPTSAPTVDVAPPAGPDSAVAPGAGVSPVGAPGGATPTSGDPAAMYAECEPRLEQPEAEGECTADTDCAAAGCSSEKCITKVAAADLMSTCEMLPCFEVVDTCGCTEGRCRWTLK